MACNSCAKVFSLLRKEVCAKCKQNQSSGEHKQIIPPDAYYKRMAAMTRDHPESSTDNSKDQEILQRLKNLRGSEKVTSNKVTEDNIVKRLQALKGDLPSVSDDELHKRLANLRGHPTPVASNKSVLPGPDVRTEQEQIDDLLKQYMAQAKIDATYKDEFNDIINDIESRVQKLKGSGAQPSNESHQDIESEDEEKTVQKIIETVKAESLLDENAVSDPTNDELPFCEICNEDAVMRCLGCKYLFCKRCFTEHRDDDDGCNDYELYKPPNNNN